MNRPVGFERAVRQRHEATCPHPAEKRAGRRSISAQVDHLRDHDHRVHETSTGDEVTTNDRFSGSEKPGASRCEFSVPVSASAAHAWSWSGGPCYTSSLLTFLVMLSPLLSRATISPNSICIQSSVSFVSVSDARIADVAWSWAHTSMSYDPS